MEFARKNGRISETLYGEWILTNGIGGYALGYGNLINMRKYHGLLIASEGNFKRMHLVSSVEERFEVNGEFMYTDSNNYIDVIYPNGYHHIVKSWLRPYPVFLFSSYPFEEDILILKEIQMDRGKNLTLLRYSNIGKVPLQYFFRYKFSLRDHHFINPPGVFDHTQADISIIKKDEQTGGSVKRKDTGIGAFIFITDGELLEEPLIYRNIYYSQEAYRGYEAFEDLLAPFLHRGFLRPGRSVEILLSDVNLFEESMVDLMEKSKRIGTGYSKYPLPKDHPYRLIKGKKDILTSLDFSQGDIFSDRDVVTLLDLFIEDFKADNNLIAGYPWFSSWGRDTMIALKAFLIAGKHGEFVYNTLNNYGEKIKNGLLPNVIGENGTGTNYDTVDAPLWFIMRVHEIFKSLSLKKQKNLFKYCEGIILNYMYNKELPFFMDFEDFLIAIREGTDLALTWMDAKVFGKPVTPRYGKPIEINALWYNGVRVILDLSKGLGKKVIKSGPYKMDTGELEGFSEKIRESMNKFFINGVWCDRIENERPVFEIRPNFVIALSLPFDFTDRSGLIKGEEMAKEKLLTPYGLRSLSSDSPMFRRKYIGNQKMRDLSYHQGTVWAWLLLPYAELLSKVTNDKRVLKSTLNELIFVFKDCIKKGGYASIAEVWDGENPRLPKGAPAQAWSCGAIYCIEKMIEGD